MAAPIAIRSDRSRESGVTRNPAASRQRTSGTVRIQFTTFAGRSFSPYALCGDGTFSRVSGLVGVMQQPDTKPHPFQSALRPLGADAGALSGVLLPLLGLGFNLSRLLAGWSSPLRFQPRKQSRCGFIQALKSFLSVVFHARNKSMEIEAWRAEKHSIRSVK